MATCTALLALVQRRHRSHRWRKSDKKKRVQEKKAAPLSRVRRLSRGRWREEVSEAIEDILAEKGVGTPGYSEFNPPVAVFALDDVAHSGILEPLIRLNKLQWTGFAAAISNLAVTGPSPIRRFLCARSREGSFALQTRRSRRPDRDSFRARQPRCAAKGNS